MLFVAYITQNESQLPDSRNCLPAYIFFYLEELDELTSFLPSYVISSMYTTDMMGKKPFFFIHF
jgi:hypothetical protein